MSDWDKSREVWQRVINPQPMTMKGDLRGLYRESAGLCGNYRYLANKLTGRAGNLAGELYRRERSISSSLRGLEILRGEDGGVIKPIAAVQDDPPIKILRECCSKSCRAQIEYTARMADPESGCVFRQLADKTQMQCTLLAELLGIL